jgi:hypothetical protein
LKYLGRQKAAQEEAAAEPAAEEKVPSEEEAPTEQKDLKDPKSEKEGKGEKGAKTKPSEDKVGSEKGKPKDTKGGKGAQPGSPGDKGEKVAPLERADLKSFHSALQRSTKRGSEVDNKFLTLWGQCKTVQEKRAFQAQWSVDKELSFCQVVESTSSSSKVTGSQVKGDFTLYKIADFMKVPYTHPAIDHIRQTQQSKPNEKYPHLEDMRLYYYEGEVLTEEKTSEGKEIKSVVKAEVSASEAHTFEKGMMGASTRAAVTSPNPKVKAKAKPKAVAEKAEFLKKWEENLKEAVKTDKQVSTFLLQALNDLHRLSMKKGALAEASYKDLEKAKTQVEKAQTTYKQLLAKFLHDPTDEVEAEERAKELKTGMKQVGDTLKTAKKASAVVAQILAQLGAHI